MYKVSIGLTGIGITLLLLLLDRNHLVVEGGGEFLFYGGMLFTVMGIASTLKLYNNETSSD